MGKVNIQSNCIIAAHYLYITQGAIEFWEVAPWAPRCIPMHFASSCSLAGVKSLKAPGLRILSPINS